MQPVGEDILAKGMANILFPEDATVKNSVVELARPQSGENRHQCACHVSYVSLGNSSYTRCA